MSFDEDWSGFFNTAEFADVVTLVSQGTTVNAIYINPLEQGELAQERQSFSPLKTFLDRPHLVLPASVVDAQAIAKGNELTVQAQNFVVAAPPQKDGTGLATVELKPASVNDTEEAWKKV